MRKDSSIPYVYRKRGVYYFSRRVPRDLMTDTYITEFGITFANWYRAKTASAGSSDDP